MKLNKSIFTILLLGSLTLSFSDMSIDAQIQEIKNAPPHERVKLMNKLKIQLADMNAEQRSEAILQLRTQTRTQSRIQSGQADNMQQMQGIERMNQNQSADHQLMQPGPGPGSGADLNVPGGSGPGLQQMKH